MRQIQSFRCFSSVLLLSSKKYSVYYSTKNNIMFKHCSTVPLNVLLKYSHFERAKQQAQLWASDAGDIFMYSCVIQHHLSTWWFQNWCLATWKYKIKSLATTETAASSQQPALIIDLNCSNAKVKQMTAGPQTIQLDQFLQEIFSAHCLLYVSVFLCDS